MAKNRTMTSQLNNLADYNMRFRQMIGITKNVFQIGGLIENGISARYVNSTLLYKSAIAFYYEPDVGLLALPYNKMGNIDIYGEPVNIQCYAANGQRSRILTPDEYVIMYDNTEYRSLLPEIRLYAQRMSMAARTGDINISQQRTPRIIKGSTTQEATIKALYQSVDRNEDIIYTYKDLDIDDMSIILAPAPYVTDRIDEHMAKIWNEFCRLVGIADLSVEKKERLISDEVRASQGGAIASRMSRYAPRLEAVKKINERFKDVLTTELSVYYYDHEPDSEITTSEEVSEYEEIEE